jgi:predicted nucleotide-binding protein (sugar kinase/HSP70/actin superfamily)
MKIGIPRALIYWKRPYFWEKFFENLGLEVLLSPKTNKEIVEIGVKISDPETCFSNKVYFGHLKWLEGKCDLIFVPRLKRNEEKLEYCPKFFGLPDLAKILVKTKILTETFDEKKEKFEESLAKLGKKLGKKKEEIERAFQEALKKEKEIREKQEKEAFEKLESNLKKIILISHPYNLYDEYVNLRIKERLEKLGVVPIFVEEIPLTSRMGTNNSQIFTNVREDSCPNSRKFESYNISDIRDQIRENSREISFHWEFAKEIMEKIDFILSRKIDGVIQISSFACGCDAVLKEFVEKKFKENKIPFLYLIIDEHTGEAGFQTRLEAFIDTIE